MGVHAMLRHKALAIVDGSVMLWDLPKSVVLSELKFGEYCLEFLLETFLFPQFS